MATRIARCCFTAVAVFGLFQSVAAADGPQPRETWHAYVTEDQRYGYEHISVERQDDGNIAYRLERRLLVDLLGQKQEISEKGTYVVRPDYSPVSLELERSQLSGAVRIRGRVEGDNFALTYERDGLHRTGAVPLASPLLFQVCLGDWLVGRLPGTDPATFAVLNETTLAADRATVRRRKTAASGSVWDVDLGPELGQGWMEFDAEGHRETVFRVPRLHLRRSTAEAARTISHRRYPDRELLLFPVDQPLGPLHRLDSLSIRVTCDGVPFDQFQFEDERQRIVRRSQEGEELDILLTIQPARLSDTELPYPVRGDDFAGALAETHYIKPHDRDISRQARDWTAGTDTALAAVRALSEGVFKHMQGGSLITETLTGPEVLQCKQGKCSEYSILFASAARSIGIPTRIVLGMRITNGSWVGHMWNEAWVGRWVTVDSTVDEVGDSLALLKLIHSDTVTGTQPLRWAVTDSLQVSIERVETDPDVAAAGLKTGIDGPVYTNAEFQCRLTAPETSWTLEDVSAARLKVPTIRIRPPQRDDVLIHFVVIDAPAAFTPGVLMSVRNARFKTIFKDYKVLKDEEYRKDGLTGRILVFQRLAGKTDDRLMKTTEVLWSDGSACYLLNLIAGEAAHDEFAADFYKLLRSFESLSSSPKEQREEADSREDSEMQDAPAEAQAGPRNSTNSAEEPLE